MQRVMLSLAAPAGMVLLLGGAVSLGTHTLERQLGDYFAHEDALAAGISEMYAQGLQMGQALRNVVLDPANKKAYENLDNAAKAYDKAAQGATAAAGDEHRKKLAAMVDMRRKLAQVQAEIVALAPQDGAAAVQLINKQETPAWRELRGELLELKKSSAADKELARVEAGSAMAKARAWVLGLAALCLAVCAFLFLQLPWPARCWSAWRLATCWPRCRWLRVTSTA
jgi:hypothetical protein